MYYKIIFLTLFLLIINLLLKKINFLIEDPKESYHKLEKKSGTPLSGGFFLFFSISSFYLIDFNIFFNSIIIFSLFLILILGIFSDIKEHFSPKLRMLFQLIIIFLSHLIFINQK